jgi:hypothetical protein
MTPEIKTLLINRDKLKRKAVISNDTDNWLHFKLAQNKCNNMLKEAKRDYYHRLFAVNKGNTKEIWNTINELMSRSKLEISKYFFSFNKQKSSHKQH